MISALGCAANTGADEAGNDESVATTDGTSEALSAFQWTSDAPAGNSSSYNPASIASTGNGLIMVHEGDDEDNFHAGNGDTDMYWASSSDGITWHDDNAISNMHTGTQPKLANVNGTVYLVHSGDHDNTVWISKLITSTSPWYFQQDVKLPYTSVASPSLVAYGSTLYFFGTTPITGQLWMATMDSTGAFSAATDIDGQTSHGVPGATLIPATSQFAFNAKLMIAYQSYDASDRIIVSTLSLGLRLPRQPAPTWVSSEVPGQHTDVQPAIAWYGGNVHLVFCEPSTSDLIYWSYFNGTSWSSEVTLGSERMQGSASLAALPDRLAMVHGSSIGDHHSTFPDFNTQVYAQIFQ